ncbi:hypothetical protein [Burkholderia stagnalis]|uniref:hypothetical protein n=1 Tax=Burkholderia stagnalis TaxID=1503054 RepID=UPI001639627F|nr:hypothetical protein [Burkholderia stagnalis]
MTNSVALLRIVLLLAWVAARGVGQWSVSNSLGRNRQEGTYRRVRAHVCFFQDPRVVPVIAAERTCYLECVLAVPVPAAFRHCARHDRTPGNGCAPPSAI